VVYNSESGEIIHGFTAITFPYGEADASNFERQAIKAAVNATGHDSSALQTLAVQPEDLEPGARYRVDVATGEIVRHPDGPMIS
jgi:hypothetical protein